MGTKFDFLEATLADEDSDMVLRQDPVGIAPERALVFVTATPISNFTSAAQRVGLEVLAELAIDEDYELDEDLIIEHMEMVSPTLYATMLTRRAFEILLQLWRSYQRKEQSPGGYSPWWNLFDMLDDLRSWGPNDRLSRESSAELESRLPDDEDAEVQLELEIWPIRGIEPRKRWKQEVQTRVIELGGRVISRSNIEEEGFIYDAFLVGMSAASVRKMIDDPSIPHGLAILDGLQFVLPQFVAQSLPFQSDPLDEGAQVKRTEFLADDPIRGLLLDGTPVVAHGSLDGGVVIDDVHDLVGLSVLANRRHATSMASLILRGDLEGDAAPVLSSRLLSIPVLVDSDDEASSRDDRLFVDVVHIALARAFLGDQPLAPGAFVVNFSIGIRGSAFAGRISSLARLLDWWAESAGVLFVVSSGNVLEDLRIPGMTSLAFEDATLEERQGLVEEAQRNSRHERALLAPSEALNALTVGAASVDVVAPSWDLRPGEVAIQEEGEEMAAVSTAHGLGPLRSIKPDLLAVGGRHDVRAITAGEELRLRVVSNTGRTGLFVASARDGLGSRERARGSSCAAAMATRAVLNAAAALTNENGPYAGQELSRIELALLTRALAVNASRWPVRAQGLYRSEHLRLGNSKSHQAKEEVARKYGYGLLDAELMREAPVFGTTLVGVGSIQKDRAAIFDLPLPPSMSGDRVHREMNVTLAWFSPVDASRARYRLAALEAICAEGDSMNEDVVDKKWGLAMRSGHLDANLIKRGTIWSRRMVPDRVRVPNFDEGTSLPIRVQCRDASGGGLNPDDEIKFAIAVSLELADTVQYDVHEEIRQQLLVRVRAGR